MKNIGFIGLGIMGRPMAKNLINAGYTLYVYDVVEESVRELEAFGAVACKDISHVASECNTIITMLPNSPHVNTVILDDGGLIYTAKKDTLIIDMSSIAPVISIDIYKKLRSENIRLLDAPVSGGEPKAIDGTLAIMVGGEEKDFVEAKPLFDILGSTATLVGPIGSGNTCKLTNQVIVALNIAALCEGMMLAKKSGTNPERVFEAIHVGLAGSTVMDAKTHMILANNFEPGFKVDLHIKDLKNALDTASNYSAPLPMTEEIYKVLLELAKDGEGQKDHSVIARYYEKLAGEKFSEYEKMIDE